MSADTLIDLENVHLTYPKVAGGFRGLFTRSSPSRPALQNIKLNVKKGESLALIGLNGSGKSTLLRIMAKIYEPNSGRVEVNGRVAALFNLGIGMRIDMSGRKNILLMGMIAGFSRQEMLELMPQIIEFSELEAVIDDPMVTYSQGMAMRLSFATITSLDPEILLLDEWIGAGDKVFRKKAETRLKDMVGRASGFVLASHNTKIVRAYCKNAIWLHEGVIRMQGPVDGVIDAFDDFSEKEFNKNR